MKSTDRLLQDGIKKLAIAGAVSFAIDHIPGIDEAMLERFLALVNSNGSHGTISREQVWLKMRLILKYIPGSCPRSLAVVADLLDIQRHPGRLKTMPATTRRSINGSGCARADCPRQAARIAATG